MKRSICWLVAMVLLGGLTGCGLKGPLYIPAGAQTRQAPVAQQTADSAGSQEVTSTQTAP